MVKMMCRHPQDVEPRHMELILSYMYRGEINVEESGIVPYRTYVPKHSNLIRFSGLRIRSIFDWIRIQQIRI